jgi:hypothetical protein
MRFDLKALRGTGVLLLADALAGPRFEGGGIAFPLLHFESPSR